MSFPLSIIISYAPFELLHGDLWGPFSTTSILGHIYFITLVDDSSMFTWVIFLKTKDETKTKLINFIAYIENQFHITLKCLRTDNGTKFSLDSFLHSKCIIHQRTCVETPQQNGVVERKHQDILNMARSISFQSNLHLNLWTFSTQHAIHIINRLSTPILKFRISYEMLHKEPPSIIHLKVVMPLPSLLKEPNLIQGLQKLCSLVSKMELRVYILYDLSSYNVFVSRNVIFYETHFALKPYTSTSITASDPPQPQPPLDLDIEPTIPLTDPPFDYPHESPKSLSLFSATIDMTPTSLSPTPDHHNDINIMQPTSISSSSYPPPSLPIRKFIHVTKPPSYLEDFHCNYVLHNTHDAHTHTAYPLSSMFSYEYCTPSYHVFC